MNATIKFVDGAFWVTIPREIASQVGIDADCEVEVSVGVGKIVIQRPGVPHYSLDDLVTQITDENRHDLIDWGPPVGREVW